MGGSSVCGGGNLLLVVLQANQKDNPSHLWGSNLKKTDLPVCLVVLAWSLRATVGGENPHTTRFYSKLDNV